MTTSAFSDTPFPAAAVPSLPPARRAIRRAPTLLDRAIIASVAAMLAMALVAFAGQSVPTAHTSSNVAVGA